MSNIINKGASVLSAIIVVIILVIIGIVVIVNTNKSYDEIIFLDNDVVTIQGNTATCSNYVASLLDYGDNYCLKIMTKEVNRTIEVRYKFKDYRIDLQNSNISDKSFTEVGEDRVIKLENLQSNTTYEIQFVKMANRKMELNNNIIIN